jgi:hypothetical protein
MSLVASCLVVAALVIAPSVLVISYKIRGPQPNNNCMIENYEVDRLGLNICLMFYLLDYLLQVTVVLIVMFLQGHNMA